MAVAGGPNIVEDGLVLCLDAGNSRSYPGSGTAWNDLSGNNNNGTLTNGPGFTANNGGGIVLDGVNDYCDLGSASSLNRSNIDVSMELVFSYSGTSQSSIVFTHRLNASNYEQFSMGFGGSGQSDFANGVAGTNIHGFFYPSLAVGGQWRSPRFSLSSGIHHVVATSSSASAILYVNGIARSTDTTALPVSGNFSNTSKTCNIGRSNGGGAQYAGNIYLVRVYSRTLTAAEVAQNYNSIRSRYGI